MKSLAPVHNVSIKVLRSIILQTYGRTLFLREEPAIPEEQLLSLEPIMVAEGVTGFSVTLPEIGDFPEVKGILPVESASRLVGDAMRNQVTRLGGTIADITWHAPEIGRPAFTPFACVKINKGLEPEMAA